MSVHRTFEARVERDPSAVALVDEAGQLSYREVNQLANRLAHHLIGLGVRVGDLIGLRVPRSARAVVTMLAVLKAGAAYVPLEDVLPAERLRAMAEECRLQLVIAASPLGWDASDVPVLSLELDAEEIAARPDHNPDLDVRGDDLMYVPYTSGSTGRPKGTSVPHRAVPGFFLNVDYAAWGPGEVCLHHCALSWDGHVVDIYPTLLSGGRLVVFQGGTSNPLAVARFARDQGVTTMVLTTAALNVVVTEEPELLAGVRHLITGGEAASRAHLAKALSALPSTRLANCYGPVECTGIATAHVVSEADFRRPTIPIGTAVGDRRVYLLDKGGGLVDGEGLGELYIGGPAVAHGYLGRPALTAERFVPDPFSRVPGARLYRTGDVVRRTAGGVLEFVGRRDDQVKIRGVRVEPSEVVATLREHPEIEDAAVVVDRSSKSLGLRLIAYVVPTQQSAEISPAVAAYLRDRLPAAMRPAALVPIDRLPLTRTGKVDRQALPTTRPEHFMTSTPYAAPETEVEEFLAHLWERFLERPHIGADDSFFELGGHSLLASQVLSRIRSRFSTEVPLRTFYDSPTLRGLATAVEKLRADRPAAARDIRPMARVRVRRTRKEGTSV